MVDVNSLNPQQREAATTIRGPVLILAGAGTGKTRVITFRIAHMIERGIPPSQILGVTFTNKAAREMQERIGKIMPARRGRDAAAERPTLCTFHSLCVRILRRFIDRLGYKKNFVIYDEAEQLGAVKKIVSHMALPKFGSEKPDPAVLLSLLSKLKNNPNSPPVTDAESVQHLGRLRTRYDAALHACNAVDFDDLILLTLRLFEEHPDVLAACREKYRYVMVDEYQDTNAAQFQLVHALTREHRNLCVVGDDDQSIYGWRGAEIANLLDLEKFFPEVKVVKLEQNYRSTNVILRAANAVIKHNVRRRVKQLWSQKGTGTKIVLHSFEDDETEARTIVEQIEYRRQIERIPWNQQAILFRTNIQSRPLETALRQASVRYHLVGGQSFFDRREIKDFVAYLKVLVQPNDDISFLRIANVPARGLSDSTMERLLAASQERKCSVYAAMKNPVLQSSFLGRARQAVEEFVSWIDRTRHALESGHDFALAEWADRMMADAGYFEDLRRSEKNIETAENRVRNLKDLIVTLDHARAEIPQPGERLQSFLEEIALDGERFQEKEAAGDAVTLITMHSCKGLEFPHVYIVGLEDGLLPHTRSKAEGTLDEERRLFYVALTRAMQTLTLSHCAGRKKYGAIVPCHPSPFLKELPNELVESGNEKGKQPVTVESGKDMFAGMRSAIG